MKIDDLIKAIQSELGVQVDGKSGPETWMAIYTKIVSPVITATTATPSISNVDDRTERNILKLLPEVQQIARTLVQKAAENGIKIKVISGLRTYEEQDKLYAQGRTKAGSVVTYARGGQSNHNFGIAFDIGVFEGTKYLTESDKYKAVGVLGMDLGLEWGGNWKTIVDEPHFQLRPSWAIDMKGKTMLAELRSRTDGGVPIYS